MKNYGDFMLHFAAIIVTLGLSAGLSMAHNQDSSAPGNGQKNSASSQSRQRAPTATQAIKAGKLLGYTVESQTGEKLGKVKDLAIDSQSGQLDFVLVATGGVAGIGSQWKAVPPAALSPATALQKTLALDITPDRWKTAPSFSKDQIANMGGQLQMAQIYKYYGQTWSAVAQAARSGATLAPTGRETGKTAKLQLASELIGKHVVNEQNKDVGKIDDVLVNLKNPGTTFALLKPGSFITSADQAAKSGIFAVPVNAFIASAKDKNLILDVNPGEFQQAPPLNDAGWKMAMPGTAAPHIYRYQDNENTTSASIGIEPYKRSACS
ncbi:MAG TPA: PRC-barrel domain-containing protein [Verrucomicrobiae bacterium]|nr:PRC-barrel domain-containing protein [Verrucomicrobiae bacterium]